MARRTFRFYSEPWGESDEKRYKCEIVTPATLPSGCLALFGTKPTPERRRVAVRNHTGKFPSNWFWEDDCREVEYLLGCSLDDELWASVRRAEADRAARTLQKDQEGSIG